MTGAGHQYAIRFANGYEVETVLPSSMVTFLDDIAEQFDTLLEAQVLAEDWRTEYNTIRPHGSLGGLTPTHFRAQWTSQPALS